MKAGRTLVDLAKEVQRQSESKKDYIAPSVALQMDKTGRMKLKDVGEFKLTKTAHDQVGGRLKIPSQYYDRMLAESPDLLANNVNHWLSKNQEKRMVRTLDGNMRAFLSDRYRPLDNFDLLECALPIVSKNQSEIVSCDVTENRMYVKVLFPKLQGEITKGDVVQAGIVISNSEVGAGSLRVEPLVYRLVCSNGMIMNTAMRKYHVGRGNGTSFEDIQELLSDATKKQSDKAFWMQVQDVISSSYNNDIFQGHVEFLRAATKDVIDPKADLQKVVEVTRKSLGLSDSHANSVLHNLIKDGDLSRWGLANAVTKTANTQEDYEQATFLERAGSRVIELPKNEWRKIAEAV